MFPLCFVTVKTSVSPSPSPSHGTSVPQKSTVKTVSPRSTAGSYTPTALDSFSPLRIPILTGTPPASPKLSFPNHSALQNPQSTDRNKVADETGEEDDGVEFTLDPNEELLHFSTPLYDVCPDDDTDQANFTLVSQSAPQANVRYPSSHPKETTAASSSALRMQEIQHRSTFADNALHGRSNSLDSMEDISKASTLSISTLSIPSKLSLLSTREMEDNGDNPLLASSLAAGRQALSDDKDMQILQAIISEQNAILASPDMRRALEKEKVIPNS